VATRSGSRPPSTPPTLPRRPRGASAPGPAGGWSGWRCTGGPSSASTGAATTAVSSAPRSRRRGPGAGGRVPEPRLRVLLFGPATTAYWNGPSLGRFLPRAQRWTRADGRDWTPADFVCVCTRRTLARRFLYDARRGGYVQVCCCRSLGRLSGGGGGRGGGGRGGQGALSPPSPSFHCSSWPCCRVRYSAQNFWQLFSNPFGNCIIGDACLAWYVIPSIWRMGTIWAGFNLMGLETVSAERPEAVREIYWGASRLREKG
jgi:hypothetical protein